MKALSIQQPWASLIAGGFKDVENRSWPTTFRGPFLIHAGKREDVEGLMWLCNNWESVSMTRAGRDLLDRGVSKRLPRGGIIGIAEITDCVQRSDSPWFGGPYGFIIANAREVDPVSVRGMLGFFEVEWPQP